MKRQLLILFAIVPLLVATAHADDQMALATVVAGLQQKMKGQCDVARKQQERASTSDQKEALQPAIELNCSCLPAQLEKAVDPFGGLNSTARVSWDEAAGIAKGVYAVCAARGIRSQSKRACKSDEKLKLSLTDTEAYCACMSDALDNAEDAKLMEASVLAYKNFQAKVKAQQLGEAEPKTPPTLVDELSDGCKAQLRK